MAEFISSFMTGFKDIVALDLQKKISGIKILNLYDGLIHYKYDGDSRKLTSITYFNNTFFVLKTFKAKNLSFPAMVSVLTSTRPYFLVNKGSFRVRFSRENQFEKISKDVTRKAEDFILKNSKLKLDRLSPTNEIWFSIRREGFGFCGELIAHREFTEKNLNKGELRPEFAYLMCCFASPAENEVICEPFCGYGSIPIQLAAKFNFESLYVSDIDKAKIEKLKEIDRLNKENIFIENCDAMNLSSVKDDSVNVFITDPPWGYYEEIDDIYVFYLNMLDSFRKKIRENGRIILLTARKQEFERAAEEKSFRITDRIDTLVNGKKACVYKIESK